LDLLLALREARPPVPYEAYPSLLSKGDFLYSLPPIAAALVGPGELHRQIFDIVTLINAVSAHTLQRPFALPRIRSSRLVAFNGVINH